ncbi:MAG: hypothetical protein LQ340_004301, partial [Diploschistes diacapsis]
MSDDMSVIGHLKSEAETLASEPPMPETLEEEKGEGIVWDIGGETISGNALEAKKGFAAVSPMTTGKGDKDQDAHPVTAFEVEDDGFKGGEAHKVKEGADKVAKGSTDTVESDPVSPNITGQSSHDHDFHHNETYEVEPALLEKTVKKVLRTHGKPWARAHEVNKGSIR